jgi:hypothetical protein
MKLDDLTGRRFGMLVVTHRWSEAGKPAKWHCVCDCGGTAVVSAHHLKDRTKSCGCLLLTKADNLIGRVFHRLTVVSRAPNRGTGTKTKAQWHCKCACGKLATLAGYSLKSGNTKSCGCLKREANIRNGKRLNRRHGMTGTRVHNIWCCMHQRCYDPKHKSYDLYGGRGILVCERWHTFENFLLDMGNPPNHLTLDRIDNEKGYEPGNCRWATLIEQANNRRDNVRIEAFGRIETIANWSREVGLAESTILQRIGKGMTSEMALSTPPRKYGHRVSRFPAPLPV